MKCILEEHSPEESWGLLYLYSHNTRWNRIGPSRRNNAMVRPFSFAHVSLFAPMYSFPLLSFLSNPAKLSSRLDSLAGLFNNVIFFSIDWQVASFQELLGSIHGRDMYSADPVDYAAFEARQLDKKSSQMIVTESRSAPSPAGPVW
jgi:hypothetical protein